MSDDNPWQFRAKCANDPVVQAELTIKFDRFHDTEFRGPGVTKAAKVVISYCADCPVRNECLQMAMDTIKGPRNQWAEGIWGGTTEKQRRKMFQKSQRTQAKILLLAERMKEQFPDNDTPIAS